MISVNIALLRRSLRAISVILTHITLRQLVACVCDYVDVTGRTEWCAVLSTLFVKLHKLYDAHFHSLIGCTARETPLLVYIYPVVITQDQKMCGSVSNWCSLWQHTPIISGDFRNLVVSVSATAGNFCLCFCGTATEVKYIRGHTQDEAHHCCGDDAEVHLG